MTQDIISEKNLVYKPSSLLTNTTFNFCPGCGHGTVVRLVMEVVEEMGIQSETIGLSPVGCSVLLYDFYKIDIIQAAHGRAPAVATGLKRMLPDKFVFTYQGDGDLAAIGTGETIHACNRGENFTIIYINNGIYGMTGGQMAPTTLPGMKTSTTPHGRDVATAGHPLSMTNIVAALDGSYFVTRQSVHTPAAVRKTKRALRTAFESQKLNKGTSFVEVVCSCHSGWKMTPLQANRWMEEHMFPYYPPGDLKVDGRQLKIGNDLSVVA
ncbi:MAG: 2-oxoglutarate oxidoreductase [Bacteroidales bacterium]|jgi:2-oxoglutarate ferredoxin oxidoreductase subunit beta|nr:2-oxoglutarate oxidoreductase [Bacteroidales bacterium]